MSFEEAMSYKYPKNKTIKVKRQRDENSLMTIYENHPNPYNISFNTAFQRMKRRGISFEEALSYRNKYDKPREEKMKFKEMDNPYDVSFEVFKKRIQRGETPEKALSYPLNAKPDDKRKGVLSEYYKLENPYNISTSTFRKRVASGMTPAEAMNTKPKIKRAVQNDATKFYQNYKNPVIDLDEFMKRVKFGLSFEEAINKDLTYVNPSEYYKNNDNPYDINYQSYRLRIDNGLTPEEALKYPSKQTRNLTKFYEEHPNPHNIIKNTFLARTRKMSPEEAISMPVQEKQIIKDFDKLDNPHKLSKRVIYKRMRSGQTLEEALSYPVQIQDEDKMAFLNHENPHNLSWNIVWNRLRSGETFEEAINRPRTQRPYTSENRIKFENHPNPYNLNWELVKARLRNGKTFEEAMSKPSREMTKIKLKEYYESNPNPYGIKYETFKYRVRRMGWSLEKALSEPLK